MRRKLAELEEKAEPVLHVPSCGEALAIERVKLMESKAHLLSGGRNPEKLAEMGPADLGSHADPTRLLDHVVHDDLNVWKCLYDAADDGLDPLRTSALLRRQRNVVPRWSKDFIDEIGILVAEGSIKGLHCLAFNTKSFRNVSEATHGFSLSVVVGRGSLRKAIESIQQINDI